MLEHKFYTKKPNYGINLTKTLTFSGPNAQRQLVYLKSITNAKLYIRQNIGKISLT